MTTFVTIIESVTAEQLEKILGIQVRSANKLRFVPQGAPNFPNPYKVGSLPLVQTQTQTGNPPKQTVAYNNVRLEWDEAGSHFFREVLDLFHQDGVNVVRAA